MYLLYALLLGLPNSLSSSILYTLTGIKVYHLSIYDECMEYHVIWVYINMTTVSEVCKFYYQIGNLMEYAQTYFVNLHAMDP